MMERTRNVFVALTVLGAFVILAALVVIFAKLPGALRGGREVEVLLDGSGGVRSGDEVHLYGIRVGYVSDVGFSKLENPAFRIKITAHIDRDVEIPPETLCYITQPMFGTARIELKPNQREFYRRTGTPPEGVLYGYVESGGPFEEIRSILENVLVATQEIIDMIGPADAPDAPPEKAGLRGVIIRLNRAVEEYQALAKDVRQTNGALREHLDSLAPKLVNSADEMSLLLAGLQRLVARMERGEGTAGKLLTDDRLYIELVDSAEQLAEMTQQMEALIQQWREEGVRLQVK